MLRDSQIDLCGQVDFTRTQPLLGRDEAFPLPAMAVGTAAVGGRISSSPGLICGGSRPVSACRPAL